jgi:hypothetical protein
MVFADARKPAPAATGNRLQVDQLGGSINQARNTSQSQSPDRLRLVQAELRAITGTPIKNEADRLRRMALWHELDELVREARL